MLNKLLERMGLKKKPTATDTQENSEASDVRVLVEEAYTEGYNEGYAQGAVDTKNKLMEVARRLSNGKDPQGR